MLNEVLEGLNAKLRPGLDRSGDFNRRGNVEPCLRCGISRLSCVGAVLIIAGVETAVV